VAKIKIKKVQQLAGICTFTDLAESVWKPKKWLVMFSFGFKKMIVVKYLTKVRFILEFYN
jgi:hypothetical protein